MMQKWTALRLSESRPAATGFQDGVDTVDVTDDDVATLNLIITADAISENGGVTTATLTRNTDTASALTVTIDQR